MRTKILILMSLLGALAGCQPDAPAPQDNAVPVVTTPAAEAEKVVQPAASEVAPSPVPVESPAMPVKSKVESVVKQKEPSAVKPVEKAVTPLSGAAVPVVAEVKPEVKAVAALSETDALALAKKSGCLICHAVDHKVVGPAWKDVAAKYRGDAGAEARLMDKVAKGGSGAWGATPMPAQSRVSETDRRSIVRFILSLK